MKQMNVGIKVEDMTTIEKFKNLYQDVMKEIFSLCYHVSYQIGNEDGLQKVSFVLVDLRIIHRFIKISSFF